MGVGGGEREGLYIGKYLSVDVDPVGCLAVIVTFLVPAAQVLAQHWLMWTLAAFETDQV